MDKDGKDVTLNDKLNNDTTSDHKTSSDKHEDYDEWDPTGLGGVETSAVEIASVPHLRKLSTVHHGLAPPDHLRSFRESVVHSSASSQHDWQPSGLNTETSSIELLPTGQHRRLSQATGQRPSMGQNGRAELQSIRERLKGSQSKSRWKNKDDIDGGYGWIIVLCTSTLTFFFLGYLYSWGVIQAALVDSKLASTQLLSVVGGLQVFFNAATCVPAVTVVKRLGRRNAALTGVVLLALCDILSSFATKNYGGILFLQGIGVGTSCGLLFMTAYPLPTQWFVQKRSMAVGFTSAGGGLGGAAFSIIIQKLVARWGLPWAFRVMGLCLLVAGLPCAWFLIDGPIITQRNVTNDVAPTPQDTSIFRNRQFLWLLAACFSIAYPFFIPAFFIPQYAQSVGYSASLGAMFGAIYNLASGTGRLGFGMFADYLVGNLTAWIIALFCVSLSTLCVWPFATDKGVIALFTVLVGLGSGGYFSLQGGLCAQIVGPHKVDRAISTMEIFQSIPFFAGPVSGGFLLDAFGGPTAGAKAYRPAMWLVGGASLLAVLLAVRVRMLYTNNKIFVKA